MTDKVEISVEQLQRVYRENALLRVFVEDLADPERFGRLLQHYAPEIFKRAVFLRKDWKK